MPREWHNRRGGGNSGATWAAKRALISIEARVIVTVSNVRARDEASQAAIELLLLLLLLLLPRPGYLHSTGCQFEAHPQAIGTGALRSADPHRVCQRYFYWNFSNLRRFLYGHTLCTLSGCVCVCLCCSLWAICCATNAQLIAHGLLEKLLAFSRIISKDLGDKRVCAFVDITIKRLRRQTSCAQLFIWQAMPHIKI